MNADECIYHRRDDVCMCWRLGHVRPNCSWYTKGVCECGGRIGPLGVLTWQRPFGGFENEPAPSLMRWRG